MATSWSIGRDGVLIVKYILMNRLLIIFRSDNDMYDHMNNSIYNFL
jgi:acyl-ACP thioesterase